jgi:hypothetical protein
VFASSRHLEKRLQQDRNIPHTNFRFVAFHTLKRGK